MAEPRSRIRLLSVVLLITMSLTFGAIPANAVPLCTYCDEDSCGCSDLQPWSGCTLRNYSCACSTIECHRDCGWICPL